MWEREKERGGGENNSRVLKNLEIHQYKVKIQKIFLKKNYQKKRKTWERVITYWCDKIYIEWKVLANL